MKYQKNIMKNTQKPVFFSPDVVAFYILCLYFYRNSLSAESYQVLVFIYSSGESSACLLLAGESFFPLGWWLVPE